MTRLLAIAAALIIAFGVFASAGIYAAPLAASSSHELVTTEICSVVVAPHVTAKLCAKRHSLGLPCSAQPAILPSAGPCIAASVPASPSSPALEPDSLPEFGWLFRPPRSSVA